MKKATLQDRLSAVPGKYPGNIALEYGDKHLSYSELDRDSAAVCRRVLSHPIPPDSPIGIYAADRITFILLTIGIFRAGCIAVPLDIASSPNQTEAELLLTRTRFILCERTLEQEISSIAGKMESPPHVIPVDDSFYNEKKSVPGAGCSPGYQREDIVFIHFKPGSAGTLTAPALTNKGLSHLIDQEIEILGIGHTTRVAQLAPPGTGTFLMEVLPALCAGAALCIRPAENSSARTPVVFMFAGLGSQYADMGLDLYRSEPLFRREIDRCFALLSPPPSGGNRTDRSDRSYGTYFKNLESIEVAQAVIFSVEYALARLLMSWGIAPHAMIGYSFGEYAAACIAGVFSLEDALTLIAARGRLLRELPPGVMTSVPLTEEKLRPLLEESGARLSLAIDNGPSCIVAGPEADVSRFETELKKKRLLTMRLKATRAVHSAMMEPVLQEFEKIVRRVSLNKPRLPFISNVTGHWITEAEAVDPNYWVKQLRETVRFADGLKKLLENPPSVFVEIGPGADLSALMRYFTNGKPGLMPVTTLRNPGKETSDTDFLLNSISRVEQGGESLARWLHKMHIGRLICKPGIFHRLAGESLSTKDFPCLTHVLLYGGDVDPNRLENWYRVFPSRIRLIDAYGSAETTFVKTLYFIQPGDARREAIPIGKPVKGARLIILDKAMNICGSGIAGDIYIRTPYRADYYNNPALSRERFIPNPFGSDPDDLVYKTGDPGKLLPDGNIVLTGRSFPPTARDRKTADPVEYVPPGNETEEKLAALWCEILKKERVGILDDFFESGGHSLGIMTLAAEIYKTFNVEMTVPQLFSNPRIKDISAFITGGGGFPGPGAGVDGPFVVFNRNSPRTLFLFPPRIAYGLDYKALARFLPRYALYAFNYLEGDRLEEYTEIIKTIQPRGPYIFLGYSAGGNLAFEVAGEIERNGGTVSHLIFLDAFENREPPGDDTPDKYAHYIETNMNAMGLSYLKERVLEKMQKYARFLNRMEHRDVLQARIHLITSADRKADDDWNRLTPGGRESYRGYGRHIEMLNPGFIEKNTEIIETILKI